MHHTIPLHLALAKGAIPCVELLLAAGADCNLQVGSFVYEFSLLRKFLLILNCGVCMSSMSFICLVTN